MKKILKISLWLILILVVLVTGISYVSYNTYPPKDKKIAVDTASMVYFQNSYETCRDAFRKQTERIKTKLDSVEIFAVRVESNLDTALTIDFCYIPAQKEKHRLLILSSGIHGIEGFTGSAIQQMFMQEFTSPENFESMGILLIHAMNPYGFKYLRKVTENNVDLNRNSDTDRELFSIKNQGYADLYDFINPPEEVNHGSFGNKLFYIKAIRKIASSSMTSMRQALLQGQYEFPEGFYYGGKAFEPQIYAIQPVLKEKSRSYTSVLVIDLHTGYGERGRLHLFPNPVEDPKVREGIEFLFNGYQIDWGDTGDFYTITGDFCTFIGKVLPEKYVLPIIFEFGTMDSQKTLGSIRSAQIMINENQGIHRGYKNEKSEKRVKEDFLELYYPPSEIW
ncbi:MAG: DUF2817 domain-containing protein, partial [Bacteroidales bacterium]